MFLDLIYLIKFYLYWIILFSRLSPIIDYFRVYYLYVTFRHYIQFLMH